MLDLIDHTEEDERVEAVSIADRLREQETRGNVVRFICAMWIAVAILLLFNSDRLMTVVNGFGVGPVQNTTVAMARTWNEQMEANGLDRLVATIRAIVEDLRDVSWDEVKASERNAISGAATLRGMLEDRREASRKDSPRG